MVGFGLTAGFSLPIVSVVCCLLICVPVSCVVLGYEDMAIPLKVSSSGGDASSFSLDLKDYFHY